MFLSIFSTLYELVIGENADYSEYVDSIFTGVGILTFVISVLFCLVFYVILGRFTNIWYNTVHWSITIAILAVLAFAYALVQSQNVLGFADAYTYQFAAFNALYAALYFVGFSFLFKNFSIHSRKTPF